MGTGNGPEIGYKSDGDACYFPGGAEQTLI